MATQTEIQERVARLNTQLRFGRFDLALEEAYRLRLYLQLGGVTTAVEKRELERVEKVIAELERKQSGIIQKWIDSAVTTVQVSLHPNKEASQETLLDRFSEPEEQPPEEERSSS